MTVPRPANRRPAPHYWVASRDDRTGHTCAACPLARRNAVHDPNKVRAYAEEQIAAHRAQQAHTARYEREREDEA